MVEAPKNREKRQILLKSLSTKNVEDTSYLDTVTCMYFSINSTKFTLSNFLIPTISKLSYLLLT